MKNLLRCSLVNLWYSGDCSRTVVMLLTYVKMTGYSLLKLVWADVVCEGFIKAVRLELCSKMMDRI